jgi:hypothetical protein
MCAQNKMYVVSNQFKKAITPFIQNVSKSSSRQFADGIIFLVGTQPTFIGPFIKHERFFLFVDIGNILN